MVLTTEPLTNDVLVFQFSFRMTAYSESMAVTGDSPLEDKGYCVCQAGDISLGNLGGPQTKKSLQHFEQLTYSVEVYWQLGFITIQIQ